MKKITLIALTALAVLVTSCSKQITPASHSLSATSVDSAVAISPALKKMVWYTEGVKREALVYFPADTFTTPRPVVFAFHGHGGTDSGFSRKDFEAYWPEAVVVYPLGLPTTSGSDKDGIHTGWQHSVGEFNKRTGLVDQDLKFFDAMVNTLGTRIDPTRIFVHGWSNGGEFAYDVLWVVRPGIAAIAPASAVLNTVSNKIPKPVLHIAGKSDPLVSFTSQQNGFSLVKKIDQCTSKGHLWTSGANGVYATDYPSSIGDKGVFLQYSGEHAYPENVPALIIKFFKQIR
jgi:poly(3-hydroxybutyrate) depolymerase